MYSSLKGVVYFCIFRYCVWHGMMSVEIQEPVVMNGLDLRELTFQNVVDNILRPSGIKIGGFPEELFLNLTEQDHQDMMCNIWYVLCDAEKLINRAAEINSESHN